MISDSINATWGGSHSETRALLIAGLRATNVPCSRHPQPAPGEQLPAPSGGSGFRHVLGCSLKGSPHKTERYIHISIIFQLWTCSASSHCSSSPCSKGRRQATLRLDYFKSPKGKDKTHWRVTPALETELYLSLINYREHQRREGQRDRHWAGWPGRVRQEAQSSRGYRDQRQ